MTREDWIKNSRTTTRSSGSLPSLDELMEEMRKSLLAAGTYTGLSPSTTMVIPETQRSNPLDLTKRSSQSTANTPTKKQKTTPGQTNAEFARSSPPTSTRPRSLSIVSQPKQKSSHQRTQSQSSQASPARLQLDTTTKMARLRAKTTANIKSKGSPQPPTVAKIFEDLTNDSDSGSELPVQSKNSQPPKSMEKLPKQPFFARTRSDGSSGIEKRQLSVRPFSVRQGSMPSLLDSEDELNDVYTSGYRSPLRSSVSKDEPTPETSQPLPPPASTQKPAPIKAKEQVSHDDVYARDFSAQRELYSSSRLADRFADQDSFDTNSWLHRGSCRRCR